MPDTDPGTVAPVVTPAPAAPAVNTPPAAPQVLASDLPDQALKARLDQAKHAAETALLTSLGASDIEEAKTAIAAARAAKEAAKTTDQKLAEQNVRLNSYEQGLTAAVDVFSRGITEAQKTAVDQIAKGADGTLDKAAWLKAYNALAPTWATQPVVTTAASVVTETTPPATTSPPAAAPAPAGSTSPPDIKAQHTELLKRNPIVAAAFAAQHSKEIFG